MKLRIGHRETLSLLSGLCLLWAIFNCGCIQGNDDDIPVMTMQENVEDYFENTHNETKILSGDYRSFDDGDTIIIRDIINKSIYDETASISYLEFESFMGYPLAFEGDISYKFRPGDLVDLTVTIIKITFFEEIDNDTWTVELETFKEAWDTTDNSFIPIPQKYLTRTE